MCPWTNDLGNEILYTLRLSIWNVLILFFFIWNVLLNKSVFNLFEILMNDFLSLQNTSIVTQYGPAFLDRIFFTIDPNFSSYVWLNFILKIDIGSVNFNLWLSPNSNNAPLSAWTGENGKAKVGNSSLFVSG